MPDAEAVHLLSNYSAAQPRVTLYNGGLSDRQLLRVTDYINDHLAQNIKLSDLAQLLGMSQFHFSHSSSNQSEQHLTNLYFSNA